MTSSVREEASSSARPIRGYLPTLDGWRAIAIAAVLLWHGTGIKIFNGLAGSGVSVFFSISGFLICSRLLEEHRRAGRISLPAFYIRRTFRIMPPYYVFLAVIAVLASLGYAVASRQELISCAFFLRNYLPASEHTHDYTLHFWSLAVEEHFYLLWPGLLLLWGPRRARWWSPALALSVVAWRQADFHFKLFDRVLPGVLPWTRTDMRLDGILWGCTLALWLERDGVRAWLTQRLTTPVWLVFLAAFLAATFGMLRSGYAMALIAFVSPFLVIGTVLRPESLLGNVLESRPFRWVGRMSYSLYLWQQLFMVPGWDKMLPGWRIAQTLPCNIVIVLACASVSYYLIERPMIRLGHRLSKQFAPTLAHKGGALETPALETAATH